MLPSPAGEALRTRLSRGLRPLENALKEFARSDLAAPADALSHITTAQLEALIAVVQHRSFALASRSLGCASPTVHRAVRELEKTVQASLFEKTSYGVKPTRTAEEFARHARLFFYEVAQAVAEIAAHEGKECGATVIGAMPLARSYLAPAAIAQFTQEKTGHRVTIVEAPYDALLAGLRRGDIDFLIGALRPGLPASDVVQEHLFNDSLSIVMRVGHPLADRRRISREDLAAFPWIIPMPRTPLRAQFETLFEGIETPTDLVECNSLSAARVLALSSDRLLLASDFQIRFERDAGLLTSCPHPDGSVTRSIGLTFRKEWRPTAAQARLVAIIRAKAAELSAGKPASVGRSAL